MNNIDLINKAAISTGGLNTGGLLNPEQARTFVQQIFESTEFGSLVRHEMRTAKTGEIDKIGIASRILREKTEDTDDGERVGVKTSKISYATKSVRLPWEITEETLRENIEGQTFEEIVTNLMTTQAGVDLLDLYFNGDTATLSGDADYNFLKIDDGWIKQISESGHVIDKTSESGLTLDGFYEAVKAIPNKYNNGKLRWLMSPHRAQEWERYLLNQAITAGGMVPESVYKNPVSIPTVQVPMLSDNVILLADPQNLCVVNTYDMRIRKTTEGKEAIMQDKRFYVLHMDFDTIIEETDATAIIKLKK